MLVGREHIVGMQKGSNKFYCIGIQNLIKENNNKDPTLPNQQKNNIGREISSIQHLLQREKNGITRIFNKTFVKNKNFKN